jgi:hypothetical protein
VADDQIGSHGGDIASHRRSGALRPPFAQVRLARSPRGREALRQGSSVSTFCQRACASVRRRLRRRIGNVPAAPRRRADNIPALPTRAFQILPVIGRLWKPARPISSQRSAVAKPQAWSEGLGRDRGEGSDVEGISGSAITYAAHNTNFTRCGASRRWPPRARLSVSMKGGGHPFAALAVGSRGVVKQ